MIPIPEKRIADFEKFGFGMFVHWGLYSQLGMGEWAYQTHRLPKEPYLKLMDTFTAEDIEGFLIFMVVMVGIGGFSRRDLIDAGHRMRRTTVGDELPPEVFVAFMLTAMTCRDVFDFDVFNFAH